MIKNVCIHVENEQPLLCDLYDMPNNTDAGLICTNVRTMDGKRPVFIDQAASTFFFPYHVIRFLEIPQREMERYYAEGPRTSPVRVTAAPEREIPAGEHGMHDGGNGANGYAAEPESLLPVAVGAPADAPEDGELELEIDEDFLQRIKDI